MRLYADGLSPMHYDSPEVRLGGLDHNGLRRMDDQETIGIACSQYSVLIDFDEARQLAEQLLAIAGPPPNQEESQT